MCPWTFTKEGPSGTLEIGFEAVEDNINSISAAKGKYPIYKALYKNIYYETYKWASIKHSQSIWEIGR